MVEHQDFEFSNLDKVLFPEDGITKGDLIEYYRKVSSVILPHLQGRPVTLQRFPDGINKESFYQKDVPESFPQWIDTATLEKKEGELQALICNDHATLLHVANLASVTLRTGLSLVDKVYHPDQMVFYLDPSGNNFNTVLSSALLLKDLLEELGLKPFVKTTGSRGLHVLVPLDSSANFEEVRAFSKEVAGLLVQRDPEHLTTEHRKMG